MTSTRQQAIAEAQTKVDRAREELRAAAEERPALPESEMLKWRTAAYNADVKLQEAMRGD